MSISWAWWPVGCERVEDDSQVSGVGMGLPCMSGPSGEQHCGQECKEVSLNHVEFEKLIGHLDGDIQGMRR